MDDPFQVKVPFTWCSNNFVTAALQQHMLYAEASGDTSFREQEAALRDWLFGCNPWGTSMIIGLPPGADYPGYPHSSYTVKLGVPVYGGLIDGPVWSRIFTSLKGVSLLRPDPYSVFQKGKAVYHDDIGDYSTNEPTMDGTACLSYVLSTLEKEGLRQTISNKGMISDENGAIIRMDKNKKTVYLIFSADEFGEGAKRILDVLKKKSIKGSFFLTGNYLRNPSNSRAVSRMIAENHFIGPHSDRHLLYADWVKRDSLLVSKETFISDIAANYEELRNRKVAITGTRYFLAPYEWYNSAISQWVSDLGLQLINLTPGTWTNADYTTPDMTNYISSDILLQRLKEFELKQENGLNGAFVLVHLGTDARRTDKLYDRLDDLITYFISKGYGFNRL
jgi:endoglucanase